MATRKTFFYVIASFLLGGVLGVVVRYGESMRGSPQDERLETHLAYLISNADYEVASNLWGCEHLPTKTVGSLLARTIADDYRLASDVAFDCLASTCTLSLSYCTTWMNQECSQLFVRYETGQDELPMLETLQCILMP